MQSESEKIKPTDEVGEGLKSKHKTGRGSQQRRFETFRKQKNKQSDDMIQAGIFARLKISDPTTVPIIPIANEIHPVVVPITFNVLPEYVDRVWDTMEAIGTRPFGMLNTLPNKNIFKKGMQILSETKLCYAQRAHEDKPDEDLPSKRLYTSEELNDFNNMAEILPYPLAIYLECIGNTLDRKQVITPVLAEVNDQELLSGAVTYAPRQLIPLLRILRDGVCVGQEVHNMALALNGLPCIEWEEFHGPAVPPALEGPPKVRLTKASYDFWITEEENQPRIRWSDNEYRIFKKIIQSMASKKGFNITTDLSPGKGALVQIVQTPRWDVSTSIEWFAMTDIPEYDQKLGAAFGFCNYLGATVQPSRFTGSYTTAYWRGEITPRRVMNAILAGQE